MSDEAPKLNIYQRLNAVRAAVAYVQKDKKVEGQNYMAVTHDAVTALVRPHLVAQGIIIVPILVASKVEQTGSFTAKNVPIIRYEANYQVCFINADSPDDMLVVVLDAHANDQGDKAPGKALSYAVKYAMLKVFSLETGEDEEQRLQPKAEKQGVHRPSDGAGDRLSEPMRRKMQDLATIVQDSWDREQLADAFNIWVKESKDLDADPKVFAWALLTAPCRRGIKSMQAQPNAQAPAKP